MERSKPFIGIDGPTIRTINSFPVRPHLVANLAGSLFRMNSRSPLGGAPEPLQFPPRPKLIHGVHSRHSSCTSNLNIMQHYSIQNMTSSFCIIRHKHVRNSSNCHFTSKPMTPVSIIMTNVYDSRRART